MIAKFLDLIARLWREDEYGRETFTPSTATAPHPADGGENGT